MDYFTIKEASKKLGVETHVLRYWEEELGLSIKRNEMGHRYYDTRNMQMFEEIQGLKEQGFSLKDIRRAILCYQQEASGETQSGKRLRLRETTNEKREGAEQNKQVCEDRKDKQEEENDKREEENDKKEEAKRVDAVPQVVEFKTAQLQSVMNRVVANALRENKEIIKESIKGDIVKEVIHQLDLVMRENEERDDERFRRLDENIRRLQQANEEVAATRVKKRRWRKRR